MRFFLEIYDKTGTQMNGDFPEEIEATDIGHALQKAAARLPELPMYEVRLWEAASEPQP